MRRYPRRWHAGAARVPRRSELEQGSAQRGAPSRGGPERPVDGRCEFPRAFPARVPSLLTRLVLIGGGPSSLCVVLRMAELARSPGADGALGAGEHHFELVLVDRAGETGGGAPHAATVSAAL